MQLASEQGVLVEDSSLVEANELAMTGHVVAYDLGWYGTFPHDGMATLFVLSTQGKSGRQSGKGGGKAERVQTLLQSALLGSNREQGRWMIQRSSTVRRSPFPFKEV